MWLIFKNFERAPSRHERKYYYYIQAMGQRRSPLDSFKCKKAKPYFCDQVYLIEFI